VLVEAEGRNNLSSHRLAEITRIVEDCRGIIGYIAANFNKLALKNLLQDLFVVPDWDSYRVDKCLMQAISIQRRS
jgi:hypothetical protein